MKQNQLLIPLRRWWWLLLSAALVAGVTCALILRGLDPTYRATATLIVGQAISNPNPTSGEFYLGQQLASVYAAIGQRDPIRDSVREALKLTELPDYAVRPLPDSTLIEVSVVDTEPQRAQLVANEISHQLILQSPSSSGQPGSVSADFVGNQLAYLEEKIQETQGDIADVQVELAELVSASDIEDATLRLDGLQTKLSTLQTNYATLLASSRLGATNFIQVLEEAKIPTRPVGPNRAIIVFLASILGLSAGAGGVFLLEFFDTTLKMPRDIAQVVESEIVGYVPDFASLRRRRLGITPPGENQELNPTEDYTYALLSTNLWFHLSRLEARSALITSLQPASGKTTTSVNLALHLARGGKKVVLVDADLRNPAAHAFLKAPSKPGLGDVLAGDMALEEVVHSFGDDYLSFVPSGSYRENPARWFKEDAVEAIIEKLASQADLVLFDSPPVMLPEALLLASLLDGVLLVVEPGRIGESDAKILMEPLRQSDARVMGVILNRIPNYLGYAPRIPHYSRDGFTVEEDLENTLFVYDKPPSLETVEEE